jgi:FdhD protein
MGDADLLMYHSVYLRPAATLVPSERGTRGGRVLLPEQRSGVQPSTIMATKQILITKYNGLVHWEETDQLAVEEPMEIRLEFGPITKRKSQNISITMRTPGADEDLAIGFLFTEGIVRQSADVFSVKRWGENMVTVSLQPDFDFDLKKLERHFYTSSSCGVCGKSSMDAVKIAANHSFSSPKKDWKINPSVLYSLPDTLRKVQNTFDATGGLHACATFDLQGNLLEIREDVGRHNALDKLIGHYFKQGLVPLDEHILLLSGRASFELLQKAAMAGIQLVCAVGAPSSLAVETAESFGITLVGFLREGRFNVYSGVWV